MRIRKAPAVAAATLLVAAGVTLANSGVAQAADCPNNVLCLYENPSWGGNVMIITNLAPSLRAPGGDAPARESAF
jgi:hypothetical protein